MLNKFKFCFYVLCGDRTGIVFMFLLSLCVLFLFLTWRARHSPPLFATATKICVLFCNQLAFDRLLIRRAVEPASPWSVGLFVIVGTK
jgi:hypothetical protein